MGVLTFRCVRLSALPQDVDSCPGWRVLAHSPAFRFLRVLREAQGSFASAHGAERGRFLPILQLSLKLAIPRPSAHALPGDAEGSEDGKQTRSLSFGVLFQSRGKVSGEAE